MTRQALGKVVVCTALLAALAVTGITQAQSAVNTSPYLNGVLTQDPNCVSDPLFQRMFNGRGGWLVIPVYEYVPWQAEDGRYDPGDMWGLREHVQAAANAGYCVILRLYWKQSGDIPENPGLPAGQWCIPPEDDTDNRDEFASWCRDVVDYFQGFCTHYIIGNEPNQVGEHGGSGSLCFSASWYAGVFQTCWSAMTNGMPDIHVIVAGVTPSDTGCHTDPNHWKTYIAEIAGHLGTGHAHYAIHNNGDIHVGDKPLDQAFGIGQFEEYIEAITNGRGTGSGCQYYIVETNPFLHALESVQYPESWLIHLFDRVASWNDAAAADPEGPYYGYRPIRCVCYYSYWLGQDWSRYNLATNGGTTANTNHNLNVAAEKDFPLLIHRNDAPRPRISLLEGGQTQVFPDSSIEGDAAVDGNGESSAIFSYSGYTGFPAGSITCQTFDNGLWPVDRMMAWVLAQNVPYMLQGKAPNDSSVPVNAELFATTAPNPIAPLKQCYHDTLMDGMVLAGDFGDTYCQSVCAGVSDWDAGWGSCYDDDHHFTSFGPFGWYEICAYPPPDRVASGQLLEASRSVTFTVEPSVTVLNPTSATISWQTNVPSTSRVDYGTTSTYGSHVYLTDETHTPVIGTTHSVTLTGLTPNTVYHYVATSTATGRTPTPMSDRTFTTTTTVPPITISGIYVDNITLTSAVVHWTTNVASNSRVDYGTTTSYGAMRYNGSLVTSHAITLTGLSQGTTYHYKVTSKRSGYQTGISGDHTFTTLLPITITNISVDNITNFSARVRWTTNVPSSSMVAYGTSEKYDHRVEDKTYAIDHAMWLTGLSAGTTYHYMVHSSRQGYMDAASEDQTFTTAEGQVPLTISEIEATPSTHSATITWTTNVPSTSMVQYRRTGFKSWQTAGTDQGRSVLTNSHSVTLTGLSSGTTYDYRVRSAAPGYGIVTSDIYQFTTNRIMPH